MIIDALEDANTHHKTYPSPTHNFVMILNLQTTLDISQSQKTSINFPNDAIEEVGNIYVDSTTFFHGSYFRTTPPIHVCRGTFQGDTISPQTSTKVASSWLIQLLLQHLSKSTCTTTAHMDDMAILTNNKNYLQPQINKLQNFVELTHMNVNTA